LLSDSLNERKGHFDSALRVREKSLSIFIYEVNEIQRAKETHHTQARIWMQIYLSQNEPVKFGGVAASNYEALPHTVCAVMEILSPNVSQVLTEEQ
ncbi:hypothetical protein HispidOSU_016237, partial [Sigmodon hispidus]